MDNNKLKAILAWIIKIGGIVIGLLYFVPAFTTKKAALSAMNLFVSGKIKISSDTTKRYAMHPELILLLLIPAAIAVLWFIFKINKDKIYFLVGTVAGAFVNLILWIVFGAVAGGIHSKITAGPGFILGIILAILYLLVTVLYLLIEFNIIDVAKIFSAATPANAGSAPQPVQQPVAPVAQPAAPMAPAPAAPVVPVAVPAPAAQPVVEAQPIAAQPVVEAQPIAAQPVVEAQPVTAAPAMWTCPSCGREDNSGNFCKSCGTKRP